MGLFRTAHGWGGGGLHPKICHTYLTMMKLITHIYSYALGKGNLIFYCTGSCENYFRLVVRQNNNNNPQFKGRQIEKWKY